MFKLTAEHWCDQQKNKILEKLQKTWSKIPKTSPYIRLLWSSGWLERWRQTHLVLLNIPCGREKRWMMMNWFFTASSVSSQSPNRHRCRSDDQTYETLRPSCKVMTFPWLSVTTSESVMTSADKNVPPGFVQKFFNVSKKLKYFQVWLQIIFQFPFVSSCLSEHLKVLCVWEFLNKSPVWTWDERLGFLFNPQKPHLTIWGCLQINMRTTWEQCNVLIRSYETDVHTKHVHSSRNEKGRPVKNAEPRLNFVARQHHPAPCWDWKIVSQSLISI